MHLLWKLEAIILFQDKGYTALAGLAVDTHQRLVFTTHIRWINRQIRNFPYRRIPFMKRLHTFADRILMGTGKGRKYQFARIWMSRWNPHLCTAFCHFDNFIHIFYIQFWVNTLGEHVVGNI